MLKGIEGKQLVSFGNDESCEWTAKNINVPGGFRSEYDVFHNNEFVAHIVLSVPGTHNILNSLAAFIAAYISGADVDSICRGLKEFKGAGRRFELKGTYKGVTIVDDYAHFRRQ